MKKYSRRFWTSHEHALAVAALAALAIGCASPTGVPRIEQVRRQYQSAVSDERVPKNASVPLYEARTAVERAEKASKAGADEAEVDHLAYLAETRIELAKKAADAGIARGEIERLSKQRDEMRIQSAQNQADESKLQALEAREDAVNANVAANMAQQAMTQTELARQQAEQARLAAEQGRQQAEQQLDDSEERARKLSEEIEEINTRTDERGLVMSLDSVLFATGSATLKPGAERVLARVADLLSRYPDREVLVEGHTDSVGSEGMNLALSRSRAETVSDSLRMGGVTAARIETRGLGEGTPVADNGTSAGRQQNRRVEIVLLTPANRAGRRSPTQ